MSSLSSVCSAIRGNQRQSEEIRGNQLKHRELIEQRALRNCMLVVHMA